MVRRCKVTALLLASIAVIATTASAQQKRKVQPARQSEDSAARAVQQEYVTRRNADRDSSRGQGAYIGVARLEFLDEGRKMRLLEPFGYRDGDGVGWPVPRGATTDGASIPWPLWSIVGGPYEGRYRNAAIVHDYYCEKKTRSWQSTHKVFLDAMLTSGVAPTQARLLYYAVYRFGPRWGCPLDRGCNAGQVYQPAFDQAEFDAVRRQIESGTLTSYSGIEEVAKTQDARLWDATPHIRYERPLPEFRRADESSRVQPPK